MESLQICCDCSVIRTAFVEIEQSKGSHVVFHHSFACLDEECSGRDPRAGDPEERDGEEGVRGAVLEELGRVHHYAE